MIKIIDCPRDAMQGVHEFIPTQTKIEYLNLLLKVGFDTLDFGSFVSPKAIPQLSDTVEVLANLDLESTKTKLLAIVANTRGAEAACAYSEINYLGFPLSVSEQFQQRNTNKSIEQALDNVKAIQELCTKHDKEQVVYLSMGFGNPYGEEWSPEIVGDLTLKLSDIGIKIIQPSDTIGVSEPANIKPLFSTLINGFSDIEFGAHLHTNPNSWEEKIEAAYNGGCRRFDGAIKGYGGCPMAKDDLVGNMATENIVSFLIKKEMLELDEIAIGNALNFSSKVFL